MLSFKKVFSVSEALLPLLQDSLRSHGSSATSSLHEFPVGPDAAGTPLRPQPDEAAELLTSTLFQNEQAQRLRLRIVGQELGHILLFAWDGFEASDRERLTKKTFIESYQIETGERKHLYAHPCECVGVGER
jgi:hypothetical protein